MLIVNSYDEFASHLGEELGCSDWLTIDQERINLFADATLDHQWIHVDVERAKVESPYKSTIAHGYLTLSVLPHLWAQIIKVNNIKMLVNYGMDKMRFGQPVVTGSRVRMRTVLHNIQNLRGICKVEIDFTIEIENQRKPALQGISTSIISNERQNNLGPRRTDVVCDEQRTTFRPMVPRCHAAARLHLLRRTRRLRGLP